MDTYVILAPVILSFLILVSPSRLRFACTLCLTLVTALVTSYQAFVVLAPGGGACEIPLNLGTGHVVLYLDGLSAFFILVTNFTVLTGLLYSNGYLDPYRSLKTRANLSLHYFSYFWLHLSMLAVLMFRDGLSFMIAWELMAVSSFMLILFEAEQRATLKTAVSYLIQMHVGFLLLLAGFLLCEADTGILGFDALPGYFHHHGNTGLFLLFFAGFAIKAGFVPFHTWLPEAHPAAPSHVSGVMSGVMIKMGIYGIMRVLASVQADHFIIGLVVLVISVVTALYGIIMAIVQTDLKRVLAYSTIENVGIIGIGIGTGSIGIALKAPVIALLGFGGALYHVMNHSLIKSLLFFGAGSVYKATHTRTLEELGGLIHKMPRTAGLFLFGAMAICALPPLNGFISELLIYYGLFAGMKAGSVYLTITMLLTLIALALTGGLALFGFSRAFGIAFLGSPRKALPIKENAVTAGMLFPKLLIAAFILMAGLIPMVFLTPLLTMTGALFELQADPLLFSLMSPLVKVGLAGIILIVAVTLILTVRKVVIRSEKITDGPTWGCGYTAGTSRQQYTGSSFTANFAELASPVLHASEDYHPVEIEEIFPAERSFSWKAADVFSKALGKITGFSMLVLKRIARLQTGNIQHYILYAFVFILVIFILLYLNLF